MFAHRLGLASRCPEGRSKFEFTIVKSGTGFRQWRTEAHRAQLLRREDARVGSLAPSLQTCPKSGAQCDGRLWRGGATAVTGRRRPDLEDHSTLWPWTRSRDPRHFQGRSGTSSPLLWELRIKRKENASSNEYREHRRQLSSSFAPSRSSAVPRDRGAARVGAGPPSTSRPPRPGGSARARAGAGGARPCAAVPRGTSAVRSEKA